MAAKKQRLFGHKEVKGNPHARWLNTAIRSNGWGKDRNVKLTYTKANGETVERKVKPMGAKGGILVAHDHERNAVRSFRLDRIQNMEKVSHFFKGFEKAAQEGS